MRSAPVGPNFGNSTMNTNLAHSWNGIERRSLPTPSERKRTVQAHAELSGTSVRSLPEIVKDVVQEHVKQDAAASEIGISGGRLSSKLSDGSITAKQIDAMGDDVLIPMAEQILESRGKSPIAVMRQAIRDARKAMSIIEQGVEFLGDGR